MMPSSDDVSPAVVPDSSALTETQVMAYLHDHPDLLLRHPDLIATPPSRWQAGKVVDLQYFMIDRLRGEIDSLRDCTTDLLHTTRSNMSTQDRTHQAVLACVEAESFAALCQVVHEDLPAVLDVDVVRLCLESVATAPVVHLPDGGTERLLGGRETLLRDATAGDPVLFDDAAGAVRSDALVRLRLGPGLPHGILALGSCETETFHATQGTELLVFLAQVVALCVRRWLTTDR